MSSRLYTAGLANVWQFGGFMKGLRQIGIAAFICLATAASAFSQTVTATLLGTVSDAQGGAVAGAKVTATELSTQVSIERTTNSSGNYEFPYIKPGHYGISVEMAGFKKEVRQGVDVVVDTSTRIDVKLQVGAITEVVNVSADTPILQTERADTGRQINAEMMEELPLGVNRNFQSLLDLVPGTTEASFQHSQAFNASSSLQTQVNGAMRMGNNYQIEGTDDNMRTGLLQVLIPPSEAIQTVDISTTNYNGELGRSIGAVTNVQFKSGTNTIHGQAYELHQNSALDARAFFNSSVGHLVYNRIGGNVGGPIKKNKIFYFADYLRTIDHEANTNLHSIPSQSMLHGDLSGDPTHLVYDIKTGDPATGRDRTAFPGNIIPTSRIDPSAAKIATYILPTNLPFQLSNPTNNYFALLPSVKETDSLDGIVDWAMSDKQRLRARFSFQRPTYFQAPTFGDAGGPSQGGFEDSGWQKTYSAGINYNRTLTPTLLTEIRIGLTHYHNEAHQTDYGKNDSEALGIPNVNVNEFTSGFVGINLNGPFSNPIVGYSPSLPWIRAEANIMVVNSWTKIVNNHTFKFGGDVRRIRDDLLQDQTYSPRGIFSFGTNQSSTCFTQANGTCTAQSTGYANNMGSFLQGAPSQTARDVNAYFPAMRMWQIFSYFNDNFRATSKLTVDMGLRWELYPPATPAFSGGFSNYDFVKNQLVIAGVGGNPKNLGMAMRWNYLAPRLGIAYRYNDKTVIRAGFGMSYTGHPDNTYAYNFPVRSNNVYNSPSTYLTAQYPDGTFATFSKGFPAPTAPFVPANGIISNPDPTSTYYVIPLDYKNPYNESWNLAVQRSLPMHWVLDVAYVGSHGVHTPVAYQMNAGYIIGAGARGDIQYPRTASTQLQFQGFSSSYNSLQVKFDRRFARGVKVTTSYTYQKAMSFQSGDDGGLAFYINPHRSYARADFDRTHNWVQSYIYDLPWGPGQPWLKRGFMAQAIGGWHLSGILSLRTGSPLTITANNQLNYGNAGGVSQTADKIAPVEIDGAIGPNHQWFQKTSFAQPTGTNWGNLGRNELTGPGTFGLNIALSKSFTAHEGRYKLDFRAESLNFSNTPQFSNPGTSLTSSNFGQITGTRATGTGVNGTGGGRVIQGGVRLYF